MKERGSGYFKLSLFFLLLNISSFLVPVTGYYLKSCHISGDNAICTKSKFNAVPQYIPSTVKSFDLSDNKISELQASNFKNFSVLTQLDLQHNNISKIGPGTFADLISLKTLNLNYNYLGKLGDDLFQGLINLTELRITHNGIKWLASTSFKSLTSLAFLDFSNNKLHLANIHTILQHLPTLRAMWVKSNHLTTFDSSELTNSSVNLTSLDLSGNPLAVFRITADVFPNLSWLSIALPSSPKRPMKWDIQNKTFLSRVSTLDISWHSIDNDAMETLRENFNASLTTLKMKSVKHTHLTALINVSCSIPSVSALHLRDNNLHYVNAQFFQSCVNIQELVLASNFIQNISEEAFRSPRWLKSLSLTQNKLLSVPAAIRNLPTLRKLDLSKNGIKTLECNDFTNLTRLWELSLHQNSISALKGCVFKDLIRLEVLKLQNNLITKLGGAFQRYLPNLKQLHLNFNELTTINNGEFAGLQSLQNLSLNSNKLKNLQNGSFYGLGNLAYFQLHMNEIDVKGLHKGLFHHLINLKTLDLRDNNIKYVDSTALTDPPFSKLSHLETLVFLGNRRHGKSYLPSNFLQGLTNLLVFNARNAQLLSFHKDTFTYTPQLQELDISSNNDLKDLCPELFYPLQGLKSLYISTISLQSLDFLTKANLTKLEFLQARRNQYSVFSEDVIKSLPALVYLDLQSNSFTCDCDNAWFSHWVVNDKQTQVYDANNFVCNYPPNLKGMKLLDLDVRSCTVDIEFIYFISSTCMILLFMLVSFTYHFLRWQLAYAYYLFQSLLVDFKLKNKHAPYQYDAFVSYNTHDEPWVIRELLPKLEGEQGWRLCLHHRDFEPGQPIIDNITNAIYGSRKTICVISRRYLESEWCSREIQVASFRLFDEQKDVLILVFLEEIPIAELSPYYRMRKMLMRRTYLSWPRAGEHPKLFWEKLRQALKTREDPGEDRFLLNVWTDREVENIQAFDVYRQCTSSEFSRNSLAWFSKNKFAVKCIRRRLPATF